ncbi:MAG: ABC transporter ATP-binding protein [Alphaproteobacteria bacterium]
MAENPLTAEFYFMALPSVGGQPLQKMPRRLYTYVWKISAAQQVRLCLMTILVFPLSLAPLELQRRIIDDAILKGATDLLMLLGGLYLAVLLAHGGLKYVRNVYQNRAAEGVTRLLRRRTLNHEDYGADSDDGTRQSIIAAEAEKLGAFVGESVSFPLLQAGIVVSVAGYMLIIEPVVAAVAIGFFLPSLFVVPLIQGKVNKLAETRTKKTRELGTMALEDENTDKAEGLIESIYDIRIRIFLLKYFMKFINNLIGQIGPLSILLVGGWMVIRGHSEIGTIVAFISGYERMINPARDLLNFYRRLSAMDVQYKLVREASSQD